MSTTTSNAPDLAISLKNVGKEYVLQKQKPYLVWDVFRRMMRANAVREKFWAVRGVTLDIRSGESVAFIGRNGAGKSTLLGLICGAIAPSTGSVTLNGRLGTLLELGAGFHPDLTGRENIYLNASLLGLGKAEIEDQFHRIVEFSELAEFIDVPLRNYSSGMQVRLGFAVAVHIDPEILIMDEALAVGDAAFQEKCLARVAEFKQRGKTILFVSHSAGQVQAVCKRVVWLEHGRVKADGPADQVLAEYAAHP